ncbi:MAG: outer membrane beta-barrel protein, partial [Myxococcales bacterium]
FPPLRGVRLMRRSFVFLVVVSCAVRAARAERVPAGEEREILLPEAGGVRLSGFFVGAVNYNSRIQMVPEFAGTAPASSEPGRVDFRFEQFSIGAFRTFGSWLSAGASIEIERHGHRHSHGFDPAFGCPGAGACQEQFESEEIATEVSLHRFNVTAVAPIGNGLSLSFGRFDTPFGYERHDAALNLTATTSELQRFGRPQSMTGLQVAYPVTPWLDVTAFVVNRWENETTDDPPEDDNRAKSIGGRIGFTPLQGSSLFNLGIGGFWGPEQPDDNHDARWIVDADLAWSPSPSLLFAAEILHGRESGVSFRRRGQPFAAPAVESADVSWTGLYALAHWDLETWLGLSLRYGFIHDADGARTGVAQLLQSFTIAPIVHLSRLVEGLQPIGVTYARTRHSLDWVDLRLEYRLAHSDQTVFSDLEPGIPIPAASGTSHQVTVQLVANY